MSHIPWAWLQVRVPTHIVSSICDDRGEEPTYAGVTMSTLMEGDFCVGDVISLLWQVPWPASPHDQQLASGHFKAEAATVYPKVDS